ncbi:MAG: tRNA delta(2)-isopentenylpyrophosphate transferase [Deltaproteobacteria bacterium DG_8]|nr:MAG: tRNA delta(2)-isopentenylpyrophosphate transferase [Deltaproteobacteria bacterium DG_8]
MTNPKKIPLIIILGPTAVGKSELAIELAQKFGFEIVNADSMQVYRGMDIGSAKPSLKERSLVTHHLIDIKDPDEEFSAAQFKEEARDIIVSLAQEGKVALVVGGTGFYIRALTKGLFPAPSADLKFREELKEKEKTKGKWYLYKELEKVDPEAASKIHPNDTFRIIRALEVFYLTGEPISQQQKRHQFKHSYFNLLKIGLMRDRSEIHHRIEQRVDKMIKDGLLDEATQLLEKGWSPTIKPFQSLGYKQILSYLQGELSLDEATRLIKRNTKRYGKRQLTWFRKDSEIKWFTLPQQSLEISESIKKFLKI